MAIIEVEHLTKEFRLGQLTNIGDTMRAVAARLRGRKPPERRAFKALDDVSFTIEEGEVVGIIGPNGAGKSTLLKILSGITKPTSGRYRVRGKVAPLIEVGAGLVGDLTGRENIYLNGAILGLSRKAIRNMVDEIVDFSELEEFIDTPVKRYSSGMKIRLGFSIATSIEAEILIVDEVLAVGDLAFQRKCFDRMEYMIKRDGRTVLIVSHNLRHIERLCPKAILFNQGQLIMSGPSKEVCEKFYSDSNTKIFDYAKNIAFIRKNIKKSGYIELIDVYCADKSGNRVSEILPDSPCCIRVEFSTTKTLLEPEIVVGIHTTDFVYILSASNYLSNGKPSFGPGHHLVECTFHELSLMPGVYAVRVAFIGSRGDMLWYGENLVTFKVLTGGLPIGIMPKLGFIRSDPSWKYDLAKKGDNI
ncbi:MAG: ABC transporter ATP-binding protein [Desulfacinum sp.]|jgi:ABC-type polysaccharide/polyol phosphate transport system ATPase subunit|nr:ABC transporter ATP-binding protein [Desulfacinum sp.]MBZ4658458.1 polysaccharide/polyol phosphate transporter ATP-binding protein [Desulfacinum sp.]